MILERNYFYLFYSTISIGCSIMKRPALSPSRHVMRPRVGGLAQSLLRAGTGLYAKSFILLHASF